MPSMLPESTRCCWHRAASATFPMPPNAGPRSCTLAPAPELTLPRPEGFASPRVCLPGILALKAPPYPAGTWTAAPPDIQELGAALAQAPGLEGFPLLLLVDDSDFTSRSLN